MNRNSYNDNYPSRPHSTSYENEYRDSSSTLHSQSYDFSSSQQPSSPPLEKSASYKERTLHHSIPKSQQPDPYDIFKRFFGTQDYKAASMK